MLSLTLFPYVMDFLEDSWKLKREVDRRNPHDLLVSYL